MIQTSNIVCVLAALAHSASAFAFTATPRIPRHTSCLRAYHHHDASSNRLRRSLRLVSMQLTPPPEPERSSSTPQKNAPAAAGSGEQDLFSKVMDNIMEGPAGQRGEIYVAIQFLLIFLVIIGPALEGMLIEAGLYLGLALCAGGLAMGGAAVVTLGDSLTPWPRPVDDNKLKKDGVFGLCRHPIYGGALYTCAGLSILSASYPRLLFTVALFALFHAKAQTEEEFLSEAHADYSAYRIQVPERFFPSPPKILSFLTNLMSQSSKP